MNLPHFMIAHYLLAVLPVVTSFTVVPTQPATPSPWKSRHQQSCPIPTNHQRQYGADLRATPEATSAEASAYSSKNTCSFVYTHLEINAMIWQIPVTDNTINNNLSILVDPIATTLDFGIAPLYRADKKFLSEAESLRLMQDAQPTHVLISQGLDDHCHLPTIQKLEQLMPGRLHYVVAPSAYDKVAQVVKPQNRITVLRHGQTYRFNPQITVEATVGSLVGPPWQERENGYLLEVMGNNNKNNNNNNMDEATARTTTSSQPQLSIYYEPHGDTEPRQLRRLVDKSNNQCRSSPIRADICILPVVEQSLPKQLPPLARFPLVHGTGRMLDIVRAIRPATVIPLMNGDLRTDGILSQLVASRGSMDEFEARLVQGTKATTQTPTVRVERPTPGQPLTVQK